LLVDRERNVIQMSYSDGRRLAFRSDNNRPGEWLLTERVDSYGNWTQLAYQAGRLAQIKDSSGRHVELSYGGSLLSNINLRHRGVEQNVRFDHDAKGRLVRAVNPLGHAEQFEYDDHLLVRYVDETGVARRFCYDERKRCILNWYQDGLKVRRLDFGADDRTVILHDSNGFRDVYRLDNGRIVSMTDPLGRRTQWIYDSNGGLMCRLMPDGRPFEVGVWDQEHRVLRATDSRGAQTEYVYDRSNGRAVISNGIQSLEITQDGKDNVAALKTSDGAEWRFEYDSRGSMKRLGIGSNARKAKATSARGMPAESSALSSLMLSETCFGAATPLGERQAVSTPARIS